MTITPVHRTLFSTSPFPPKPETTPHAPPVPSTPPPPAPALRRSARGHGHPAPRPRRRPAGPRPRRVQRSRVAAHRPGGQPLLRRGRDPRRCRHLLRRRSFGRHLQDDRRRRALGRHLRRPAGPVDRFARGRHVRSEHRLGRNRRREDPQPRLGGAGGLQVHRRGRNVDPHGPGADRPHPAPGHPPHEPRHRLHLCARALLRAAAGTRHLPHHGRRRELGARPVRRREHRLFGHRDGSVEPEGALRGHLAAGDPHLGADLRRARRGLACVARRRRQMDQAQRTRQRHRTAAEACRQGRGRDRAFKSGPGLRPPRNGRRHPLGGTRDGKRAALALGGRRAHVGADHPEPQRHGTAALLLARGRVPQRRGRGVLPDRFVHDLDRRGTDAGRHPQAAARPAGITTTCG